MTDPRLFAPQDTPRLFHLPPGADFAGQLVAGLRARLEGHPPEAAARVTVLVNTRRMQRRLREVWDAGPPALLPRLRLITDLALDPLGPGAEAQPPVPPLRRRLELAQLIGRLIEAEPDLAPRAALYDLADSLARLMDEMQGEGVDPDAIEALDVTDQSGHWQRSLRFLRLVQGWFGPDQPPDLEARQRLVVEHLAQGWRDHPPAGPMIVAGSTGSRGATQLLMQAVARLEQGAVVLPGFDADQPQAVWDRLDEALTAEDHPQYRFAVLLRGLGMTAGQVAPWTDAPPADPARNRLISLSLRPAPVTDQWRAEGAALGDLGAATARMTLVEAQGPRAEAEAIALGLRMAIEQGRRAMLITPDRMLTRQVAAALGRWGITPDDSAGMPLPLSAPGRFLRQVAMLGPKPGAAALLALLKHPLTWTGADRGMHLLNAQALELHLRRQGCAPTPAAIRDWANGAEAKEAWGPWADWLTGALESGAPHAGPLPLAERIAAHLEQASLWAGPTPVLWDEQAGRAARRAMDDFAAAADAGGDVGAGDYLTLLEGVLRQGEVRDRDTGHPLVLIRGTLEARVEQADLTILGGLNEGSWPEPAAPDPWLNRALRRQAGLLLPERQIGLSAHDFMQSVAAPEVWLTRATRSSDAPTVPSRWLNRLTNLLDGLPDQGGREALAAMRERGSLWAGRAAALSAPERAVPPAPRPSPRPPVAHRPSQLPVTGITRLIRDPYAVYARYILRLYPQGPLTPQPDALLRGTVLHAIYERFIEGGTPPDAPDAQARLLKVADAVLAEEVPWPVQRRLWHARIARSAPAFLSGEVARQARATPSLFEQQGRAEIASLGFTLTAKADRIDLGDSGGWIYDYKTGTPPSDKEQRAFEKQLLLEAAILERAGFGETGPMRVAGAAFIGVGRVPKVVPAPLDDLPPGRVWEELTQLIARWQEPQRGYSARMAVRETAFEGDYDHLARSGEWDLTTKASPEDVG
ncbi:PD-(D/E)XK nuclease family protein [Pseudoroseicyclus aestuarii]|uniref:Inactivated superfamily I helicase n=1 Tax=Pseudoroseicyclus aestuarii TaxID=1795041 RepID=A0A318SXR4_9RHOB|nr:PD-(D/E)XK nuclease family protein [Pseudoroseicyclus aestuarii]PYE84627.1 inactivated superfamily I helicase [Pseudoroseicyclus aestuarii]